MGAAVRRGQAVRRRRGARAPLGARVRRGGTAQVTNTPTAEAASQRDRFLAAFAHELRTPLAVARGWVALLDEGDIPPSMLEETVGRLDDSLASCPSAILDVELGAGIAGSGRLSPTA